MLESVLNATIFKLCYYIEHVLCWAISILTQLFEVFAGLKRVTYSGKPNYLINIFFSNKAISNIYWGMALIGVVMLFMFTIFAVIRKMADVNSKQQNSLGEIIGQAVKSFFLIISMTLIMTFVISFTNELMQQVNFIFNNAYHLDQPATREFSEEEYAAMGRVLATVGNYSIVQSSTNRYNLNLCYNDIRSDMYYLQQQGVFDYSYYTTDKTGKQVESWQSVLARIAKATDLSQDVKVDIYNQGVASSLTYAMEYLQKNSTTSPLPNISRTYVDDNDIHLDRLVFLIGTTNAAKNPAFNKAPMMDDALRGPYYYGQGRSLYNFDQVNSDFNIGFPMDYIVVWMLAIALIYDLVVIILNCITRLFNMLFLYIIAPPVIAASPLDGGGKFKQWTIAFLVQSFSVFGTVIAMRLLTIYLPIVISPQLVLFENQPTLNMFAKFVLAFGGFEAAKKSTGLLTGILADSAGWQSIQAGDMSGTAAMAVGKVSGTVKGAAGLATSAAGKVLSGTGKAAGFAFKPLTNAISQPFKNAAEKWSKLGTGGQQKRIEDQIRQNKAIQAYKDANPNDAPYLSGGRQGPAEGRDVPPQNQQNNPNNPNNPNNQNNQNNQNNNNNNNNNNGNGPVGPAQPPQLPERYNNVPAGGSNEAPAAPGSASKSLDNKRAQFGLGPLQGGNQGGGPGRGFRDDTGIGGGQRPFGGSGDLPGNNRGNNGQNGPQGGAPQGNLPPVQGGQQGNLPPAQGGQQARPAGMQQPQQNMRAQGGQQSGMRRRGSVSGNIGNRPMMPPTSPAQPVINPQQPNNYRAPQQGNQQGYQAPGQNNNGQPVYQAPAQDFNNQQPGYQAPAQGGFQGQQGGYQQNYQQNYRAPQQGNVQGNNYQAPQQGGYQQNYRAPQGGYQGQPQNYNNQQAPQQGNNYQAPQQGGYQQNYRAPQGGYQAQPQNYNNQQAPQGNYQQNYGNAPQQGNYQQNYRAPQGNAYQAPPQNFSNQQPNNYQAPVQQGPAQGNDHRQTIPNFRNPNAAGLPGNNRPS